MVLAWGMAQRPYVLPTTLTVEAGAGDPDSLRWLVIVTVVAVLVVGPALALLYRLDFKDRLAADHDVDLTAAHAAPEAALTSAAPEAPLTAPAPGGSPTSSAPADVPSDRRDEGGVRSGR
jgi:hypothetical protein